MTTVEISGESSLVQANGLRHRVLRYGEPGARDLLFLPGITSPAETADFLAVLLAGMGFRVTVPDVRGRGQSDRAAAGQYRLTDYAADAAGLVEALELVDPVVVGHSMGARIAAAWAVLHAPERRGLVLLVDPPVSGPGRGPYPTGKDAFLQQLHEAQAGTDAAAVRRFYPKWPERELQLRAEVLASCDETAVLETHEGFETEDFFPYWAQLAHPAVLVRGGDSPVVPLPAVADLRRARSDIRILTVPGAGHMVPWDALPAFLDAVRPHLLRQLAQPAPSQH
jgi:N-formylmaleamate deformylase